MLKENSIPNIRTTRERFSNIELLRVVSMFLVLAVHIDGASLGLPSPIDQNLNSLSQRDIWKLAIESFTIIGVNCFTLISGYFGINLRLKTIINFLAECLLYSVGIFLLASIFKCWTTHEISFNWSLFADSFMILTHNDLWYVPAYFILCLFAPFLNAGCKILSRRQLLYLITAFTIFTIWAGWWNGGKFNQNGYTAMQLIMIYLIGRLIALFFPAGNKISRRQQLFAIFVYLLASIATFISAFYLDTIRCFAYNSPFIIISSIAFFIIFLGLKFKSKIINWLAAGAFAVYLIHKNPLIWGGIMRPYVIKSWENTPLLQFSLKMLCFACIIYLSCAIVDWARRKLFKSVGL